MNTLFRPNPSPHQRHLPFGLISILEEMRRMGATDADLHRIIDMLSTRLTPDTSQQIDQDDEAAPMKRAALLISACLSTVNEILTPLKGTNVVIAGEFPPHLIEFLLSSLGSVVQFHPPSHGFGGPPHFRHLAPQGLRGITDLRDMPDDISAVIVHAVINGSKLLVSPLLPLLLQARPSIPRFVVEAHHAAPHHQWTVPYEGFTLLPLE